MTNERCCDGVQQDAHVQEYFHVLSCEADQENYANQEYREWENWMWEQQWRLENES